MFKKVQKKTVMAGSMRTNWRSWINRSRGMVPRTLRKWNSSRFLRSHSLEIPGHFFADKQFFYTIMCIENRCRRVSAEYFLIFNKYFVRFPKIIARIWQKNIFLAQKKKIQGYSFQRFPDIPGHIGSLVWAAPIKVIMSLDINL